MMMKKHMIGFLTAASPFLAFGHAVPDGFFNHDDEAVVQEADTIACESDYEAQTAEEKQKKMEKAIVDSSYIMSDDHGMPEFRDLGFFSMWKLFKSYQVGKAFDRTDDQMHGDEKLFHRQGTVIMARLESVGNHGFTGHFQGSEHLVIRASVAKAPSGTTLTPGLAVMFLANGAPSTSIFVMPSLDGIESTNFFEEDMTHILPESKQTALHLVENTFKRALKDHHSKGCARSLTLAHIAAQNPDGTKLAAADRHTPAQIVFKATPELKALTADTSKTHDFRLQVEGRGQGMHLFDVYSKVGTQEDLIARIHGTSIFVASQYGDEELFFRHQIDKVE